MARFIAFGRGTIDDVTIAALERFEDVRVLDRTGNHAVLLQAPRSLLGELKTILPDCIISEEIEYDLPEDPIRTKSKTSPKASH